MIEYCIYCYHKIWFVYLFCTGTAIHLTEMLLLLVDKASDFNNPMLDYLKVDSYLFSKLCVNFLGIFRIQMCYRLKNIFLLSLIIYYLKLYDYVYLFYSSSVPKFFLI